MTCIGNDQKEEHPFLQEYKVLGQATKRATGGLSRGREADRGGKRKDSKITPNPLGPILHFFDHFWKDGLRKYNYSQLSITAKEGSPFQVLVIITTRIIEPPR